MKIKIILAALLTTVLTLPAKAAASEGAVASFSLALTLKKSLPGTFVRDENGKFIKDEETKQRIPTVANAWEITKGDKVTSFNEFILKTESFKYGTKELLLDLKEAGILDDSTISGWSVKAINFGISTTQAFYLVKKGKPPVNISSNLSFDDFNYDEGEASASSTSLDQTVSLTTVGGEQQSLKYKYNLVNEGLGSFRISINSTGGNLYGPVAQSQKAATSKSDDLVYLINVSMPVMVGSFDIEGGAAYAKGSIKISGAKLVEDLSTVIGDS